MDRQCLLKINVKEIILPYIPIGRENAITAREITRLTGIGERSIQGAIEELRRENDDLAIVAAMSPPYGYYIPRDESEALEWDRQIDARIRSLCVMRNCVRMAYSIAPIKDDQYRLRLG